MLATQILGYLIRHPCGNLTSTEYADNSVNMSQNMEQTQRWLTNILVSFPIIPESVAITSRDENRIVKCHFIK